MGSFVSTFERIMMPIAGRISSNKYLLAMRDSFSMLLPFIIVGSFFGIIEWVVLDPWGTIMGENGLNLGAPAMLFNIQEPLAFGLPIVLNPMLLIPYILAPLANTVVGWLAVSAGLVPIFKYVVPWTMPLFFGGTIGTGSVMGGLLQVVWLVMDVCIYAPFVIAANKVKDEEEDEPEAETEDKAA